MQQQRSLREGVLGMHVVPLMALRHPLVEVEGGAGCCCLQRSGVHLQGAAQTPPTLGAAAAAAAAAGASAAVVAGSGLVLVPPSQVPQPDLLAQGLTHPQTGMALSEQQVPPPLPLQTLALALPPAPCPHQEHPW